MSQMAVVVSLRSASIRLRLCLDNRELEVLPD